MNIIIHRTSPPIENVLTTVKKFLAHDLEIKTQGQKQWDSKKLMTPKYLFTNINKLDYYGKQLANEGTDMIVHHNKMKPKKRKLIHQNGNWLTVILLGFS